VAATCYLLARGRPMGPTGVGGLAAGGQAGLLGAVARVVEGETDPE